MNYIIFEDNNYELLKPFSDLHATFEMKVGAFSNIDRIINQLLEEDTIQLYVREEIEDLIKERYPDLNVNPDTYNPGFYFNGNCIWDSDIIKNMDKKSSYCNANGLVGFHSDKHISKDDVKSEIEEASIIYSKINILSIRFLWDIFNLISDVINLDNQFFYKDRSGNLHPSCVLVNQDDIIIREGVEISASSTLDATNGPIIIDKNSFVDIGSLIKGPVYIGENVTINPGCKIRGSVVVGSHSKIGGEIEDSVIHGYSNKQHDGFLGHSYICEWVNMGANTNTSDLKNNYSNIRMKLDMDDEIKTDNMFIGSLIGDFCCTAISTKLNSGTFIGIGSNLFDHKFQDKYISSFSWGRHDKVGLNRFIKTSQKIMGRRNKVMSDTLKSRLIQLYKK